MEYTLDVIAHFMDPQNVGEIEDADGVGTAGDASCGDYFKMYIKVQDGVLSDVKFQVMGCVAAIATCSITTEMAMNKTLEEAFKITNDDVAKALGGLPPQKLHCSNSAATALHNAIKDYFEGIGCWLSKS